MSAVPGLKKYAARFWALGYSRVALVVAVVLCLLALVSPVWSVTLNEPRGGSLTTTYSWGTVTMEDFSGGAWQGTAVLPYTSDSFHQHAIAASVGASFLAVVVFVIVLLVILFLFSTEWGRGMPRVGLLITAALAVIVGLLALFYPLATVPGAAAADWSQPAITGFWGSTTTGPPNSWGAGLGWWLLLVAVVLGCLGSALPYLRHMRVLPETHPRSWHPPQ